MPMVREFHVLNLGAGVQSTTLYLMGMRGELEHNFDVAIFADPGDEPESVYKHLEWLEDYGVPHETPRSACVFCPFHSDDEWRRVRRNDADWKRACEIDDALRDEKSVVNRGLDSQLYVHRSCRPLREVDLDDSQMSLFDMECEGGCGL